MAGPCQGIRVIEMARYVSAPYAGQILADLGAEVIKIEETGGDLMRGGAQHNGMAGGFQVYNRGKKSFAADLRDPQQRAHVRQLCEGADIVLENFRPGVLEKMGLGYDDLSKANPRLIYIKVTGYGETGPFAQRPVFDQVVQGVAGFMPLQGNAAAPRAIQSYAVDKVTAIWVSHAALGALLHRANTGEGQKVNVSLLNAYAAFILPELMGGYTFMDAPQVAPVAGSAFEPMQTADGHVIGLALTDAQFGGLCEALELQHLARDPRNADLRERFGRMPELMAEIGPALAKLTTEEFLARAARLDLPYAKVNTIAELIEDPRAIAAETLVEFDDPELGRTRHVNHPVQYSRSPANVRKRAARYDEHTADIVQALKREGK